MRSSQMHFTHRIFTTICGISLAAGFVAVRAQADEWDKLTTLTVHEPIQVQDKVLEPGKYVFKLVDSSSDRHIVRIFNGDQSQVVDTLLAIPNYRLHPSGHSQFEFWETPPGRAKALRAWFYPGDNFGQEFTYPKHLALLTPPPAPMTSQAAMAPEPAPVAPPLVAAPQSETAELQPEQPQEMAQNTAPAPEPQAVPAENEAPSKLPKTASAFPTIGFVGLSSLGLYALLRLRRVA